MSVTYNSAVSIVAAAAANALSVANGAASDAAAAAADAATALTAAQYAQARVSQFVGNTASSFDSTAPTPLQLTGSSGSPLLVKPTADRTYTYTWNEITQPGQGNYQWTPGTFSSLIKLLNISQSYTLTLSLQNSGGSAYLYVVQPGESIVAFYDATGSGAWIFASSVI
jgi:hypothetical protein